MLVVWPPKPTRKMGWLHCQQDTGTSVALHQKPAAATGNALDDDNKEGAGHESLFASGGDAISSAFSCR